MNAGFAHSLLREGRLLVGPAPVLTLSPEDVGTLKSALESARLHLPGPRLAGTLEVLIQAVSVVYRMARRFLHPEPGSAADDPSLRMPAPPRSAADHFAADLAFRFLPGLHQRVVSRDPEDELAAAIKALLRQWPLSGVLADISEPPETAIEFDGHLGLGFLYAERLAARERAAWIPTGSVRDCVEVVYQSLSRTLAGAPATAALGVMQS